MALRCTYPLFWCPKNQTSQKGLEVAEANQIPYKHNSHDNKVNLIEIR